MNKFANALAVAVIFTVFGATPAFSGTDTTAYSGGNFYGTAQLDTTQVVQGQPNHYSGKGFVCFRSEQYPKWGCVRAEKANPKIFTDPRVTDIRIIPDKES